MGVRVTWAEKLGRTGVGRRHSFNAQYPIKRMLVQPHARQVCSPHTSQPPLQIERESGCAHRNAEPDQRHERRLHVLPKIQCDLR